MKLVVMAWISIMAALPLAGQARTGSTTFSVELKPSAAEQFRYASTIMKRARETGMSADEAAIQQAAALELIPQRWPQERRYAVAAYQQAVQVLAHRYPLNAIDVANRAERYAGNDPEMALIRADKAAALMSVGRAAEAEVTFRAATQGAAFDKLDPVRQRATLKKAAFFFERQKQFREAASLLRRAAPLGASPLDAVFDDEKVLELTVAAGDMQAARADFDALVQLVARVRAQKLTPQELQQLPDIDRYIDRYRRKLHL